MLRKYSGHACPAYGGQLYQYPGSRQHCLGQVDCCCCMAVEVPTVEMIDLQPGRFPPVIRVPYESFFSTDGNKCRMHAIACFQRAKIRKMKNIYESMRSSACAFAIRCVFVCMQVPAGPRDRRVRNAECSSENLPQDLSTLESIAAAAQARHRTGLEDLGMALRGNGNKKSN